MRQADTVAYGNNVERRRWRTLPPAAWRYDPSDMTTLFQDSAMTTPVTAAGDRVGAIREVMGYGPTLLQATAASRGTYRIDADGKPYIEFAVTQFIGSAAATWGLPLFLAAAFTVETAIVANVWGIALNTTNYMRIASSDVLYARGDLRSTARGNVSLLTTAGTVPLSRKTVVKLNFSVGRSDMQLGNEGEIEGNTNTWVKADRIVGGSLRAGNNASNASNFYGGVAASHFVPFADRERAVRWLQGRIGI